MKNRKIFSYVLSVFALIFVMASCSDEFDDAEVGYEGTTSGTNWDKLEGVYRGAIEVTLEGIETDSIIQQIEIKSDDRNVMNLFIAQLFVDGMEWSKVSFKDVYFQETVSNAYSLKAHTVQSLGEISNVAFELTGTITGETLKCHVVSKGQMSRPITFDFEGTLTENVLSASTEVKSIYLSHDSIVRQPSYFGYKMFYTEGDENIYDPFETEPDFYPSYVFFVHDSLTVDSCQFMINPIFEVADGATVSIAADSVLDFSKPVIFTVLAEDQIHRTEYAVVVDSARAYEYEFGVWSNNGQWDVPENSWTTNSEYTFEQFQTPLTKRTLGIKTGDWAVEMRTEMLADKSGVVAGELFQGEYLSSTADAIDYGVNIEKGMRPIYLRGYYKYLPSPKVYVGDKLYSDTTSFNDTCQIRAIVYDVTDTEAPLDAVGYLKDTRVVLVADLGTRAGTFQSIYQEFSLSFLGIRGHDSFDPTKDYKVAIICSSSKSVSGLKRGAPGSVLTVGGFEVMYRK